MVGTYSIYRMSTVIFFLLIFMQFHVMTGGSEQKMLISTNFHRGAKVTRDLVAPPCHGCPYPR